MAGIYVHIPFCRRKCHYCNFFSVASLKNEKEILDSVLDEIFLQRNYLSGKVIQSIYLGGGTPSLLDPDEIANILEKIGKYFVVSKDAEITLEANPDDLDKENINKYLLKGINRISIGVQSFHDADLIYLNRIHNASQALNAIKASQSAGFDNISIDLIYGIPGLTDEQWQQNLETAFNTGVHHISAYALTVEPKTALDVMIGKNKIAAPDEETIIDHFTTLMVKMKENGYVHYEISNFCREGYCSRHNSMYWNGEYYLGLGPSAHSYNGISRQWNIPGIKEYIERIRQKEGFFESETLTREQHYNEYVMTSLRTMWGCDLKRIRNEFGEVFSARFSLLASRYLKSADMIEKEGIYYLTDQGKLFADGNASDFFIT